MWIRLKSEDINSRYKVNCKPQLYRESVKGGESEFSKAVPAKTNDPQRCVVYVFDKSIKKDEFLVRKIVLKS